MPALPAPVSSGVCPSSPNGGVVPLYPGPEGLPLVCFRCTPVCLACGDGEPCGCPAPGPACAG